jgi:hypothetical protein
MQSEDRMITKTRRRYTEEFKAEAVRLIRDSRPRATATPVSRCGRNKSSHGCDEKMLS